MRGGRGKSRTLQHCSWKIQEEKGGKLLLAAGRSGSGEPLGLQQLFGLLVVVVERRQSSGSQRGPEGGEDREGPSQVAPDRLQESGEHLGGEQEGAAKLA